MNLIEPLPHPVQTALVFAARYTHHRNTGGTLAVCRALKLCWDQLSNHNKKQIIEESHEATCNLDDWHHFREFAKTAESNQKIIDDKGQSLDALHRQHGTGLILSEP